MKNYLVNELPTAHSVRSAASCGVSYNAKSKIVASNGVLNPIRNEKKESYFVIIENFKTRGLRILLNIFMFSDSLFSRYKFISAAGLYGSAAKGENKKEPDIDLWVKVEKVSDVDIVKLHSELGKELNGLNLLVLNDAKINELKKKDEMFYHSLVFGSIILYGEKNEI